MSTNTNWLPVTLLLAASLGFADGASAQAVLSRSAVRRPSPDPAGTVVWRFRFETAFSGWHVAVGPDGTVYAADNLRLYALTPAGDVKWTVDGLGGSPVDFVTAGTLVAGTGDRVVALDADDGSTIWTFTWNSNGLHEQIWYGPNVGPDGNVYAVTSTEAGFGLGAFSLTPLGALRWEDQGSPPLDVINGSNDGLVFFSANRLFFPFRTVQTMPVVYGFDLDGDQTFDPGMSCSGLPRTDPGRLLVAGQCGLDAFDADTSNWLWGVQLGAVTLAPAVGLDGVAYTAAWVGSVTAVSPAGDVVWTSTDGMNAQQILGVTPDDAQVVYAHSASSGSGVGVMGLSTTDGSKLWETEMAPEGGHFELPWSKTGAFSTDGSVTYFTTRYTSNGAPGALYAVRTVSQ